MRGGFRLLIGTCGPFGSISSPDTSACRDSTQALRNPANYKELTTTPKLHTHTHTHTHTAPGWVVFRLLFLTTEEETGGPIGSRTGGRIPAMRTRRPAALLSLYSVMLFWPFVAPDGSSPRPEPGASISAYGGSEQEELRPRVERLTMQSCDPSQEGYCLNNGQCRLLVDNKKHHCKCERGYYGPRCAHLELVFQPLGEEQLLLTVVCVTLLLIGLAGALYFFCKWYKRIRCPQPQRRHGYQGVQSA